MISQLYHRFDKFFSERFMKEVYSYEAPPESDGGFFLNWVAKDSKSRYSFISKFVKGKKVLELGSGYGFGCDILKRSGATSIIGIELNKEYYDYAVSNYGENCKFINCNCLDVPLPNNSLDIILGFEIIEHLHQNNRGKFVKECSRLLKKGGIIIISTPNRKVVEAWKGTGRQMSIYHKGEMTTSELIKIFSIDFKIQCLYRQTAFYKKWPIKLRFFCSLIFNHTKVIRNGQGLIGLTNIIIGEKI